MTLPFNSTPMATKIQLYIIFAGFAFSTCGLLWAPLWKIVKNHNTEYLVGIDKEKKVGANNGLEGATNGFIGLFLALLGILLLLLSSKNILPTIDIGETSISLGFYILVTIYVSLIITSLFLTIFCIKNIEDNNERTLSLKSLIKVIKSWKIWCLGLLVLGVYMLQMGLSAYMNYLTNVFGVLAIITSLLGISTSYIIRFLVSSRAGKRADRSHSYIVLTCLGLLIGIILVVVAISLSGFDNDFVSKGKTTKIIIGVVASINMLVLGVVVWGLVTIRWSPIGTELKIDNDNYASAVGFISVIAFTPDAFFRTIKSVIEKNHSTEYLDTATGNITQVANQVGNQLILATTIPFALIGLISGLILYISIYKKHEKFVFRKLMKNK
ncbi:hypothetical protein [[Acholeplasma] multilocale]|uniref:hypothetical protein n=1 Tax=[Acholeplasma] multilocale TaxID=264638 RepID=UPI000686EF56|nr:hypothetical protein [[Acholeplasma] multilocale]